MKHVLIYYKDFISSVGGARFLPLLFIAELQKTCEVTLALDIVSDVKTVAETMNIPIDFSRLRTVQLLPDNRFLRKLDSYLPFYRVRQMKKLAKNADVCISTSNIFDFGRPAHHFVFSLCQFGDNAFTDYFLHNPLKTGFALFKRRIRTFIAETLLRPMLGVRSTRKIIADRKEHIYPNSMYVDGLLHDFYGPFTSTVFYPPTSIEFKLNNIERAPLRVNYIGRISETKRIDDIILIVEQARELSGQDFSLYIAGKLVCHREDHGKIPFMNKLQQLSLEKPWIHLVGEVYGENKERFLLSGTYAVHAMREEAFGISVTEYLKAGCIPIVPDEGGTVEIVDSPALTYHTNEEAARILVRLHQDKAFYREQLAHCMERAKLFSREAYFENQHLVLKKILSETE